MRSGRTMRLTSSPSSPIARAGKEDPRADTVAAPEPFSVTVAGQRLA